MKLIFVTTSLVFYFLIPLMMDTVLSCSDVPEHLRKVAVNLAVMLLLNNREKNLLNIYFDFPILLSKHFYIQASIFFERMGNITYHTVSNFRFF